MITIVFGILCILLIMYIIYIQMQLYNINRQLTKRLREKTGQPISLELINRDINTLATNINKCLDKEEKLRIDGIKREKRFKELIANISHDLRTPLTAIKGYQQLIEKSELTDNQRKKLEIAQKHTVELGQLIEHFFEYSCLINAEPELDLQRINLTNVVIECLAASVPILEENNLAVHIEETAPIFVLADKEMVLRIVQNLIRNCVQHSSGDIEVQLLVMEKAVISFRNPVKSTSDINVERIFDRLYTGDKARSNTTGLGLSIVRLLVELMGGSAGAALNSGLLEVQVRLPLFKDN